MLKYWQQKMQYVLTMRTEQWHINRAENLIFSKGPWFLLGFGF